MYPYLFEYNAHSCITRYELFVGVFGTKCCALYSNLSSLSFVLSFKSSSLLEKKLRKGVVLKIRAAFHF